MPVVEVKLLKGRTTEQKAKIAEGITKVMAEHARVSPDATFVIFMDVERSDWASSGKLMSEGK